jgi:hypothetical protein
MTEATAAPPIVHTELRCLAPHPDRKRFARRTCNEFIVEVPLAAEPTGTIVRDRSRIALGLIPARCPRCRANTEYQIVAPDTASAAG